MSAEDGLPDGDDDDIDLRGLPPELSGLYGANEASRAARAKELETKFYAPRRALYEKYGQELAARRAGPTSAERLYEIGAALMSPTKTPGFGGMIANVAPVMAGQRKAMREAEDAKSTLLTKYQMDVGEQEGEQLKAQYSDMNAADAQRFALLMANYRAKYAADNRVVMVRDQYGNMIPMLATDALRMGRGAVNGPSARPPGVPPGWVLHRSGDGSQAYVNPADPNDFVEVPSPEGSP